MQNNFSACLILLFYNPLNGLRLLLVDAVKLIVPNHSPEYYAVNELNSKDRVNWISMVDYTKFLSQTGEGVFPRTHYFHMGLL